MSITFEQQEDGTFKQVDDPPKRADMVSVVRCDERMYEADHCRIDDLEKRIARIENLLNHKTRA